MRPWMVNYESSYGLKGYIEPEHSLADCERCVTSMNLYMAAVLLCFYQDVLSMLCQLILAYTLLGLYDFLDQSLSGLGE